jgi:hypothetical protein
MMTDLTKGQARKLTALKKSIGDELGQKAFNEWLKAQPTKVAAENDLVAEKIVAALSKLEKDPEFNRGRKGYTVTRAKGKGASGLRAFKNQ